MAMEVAITLRTDASYDASIGALVAEEAAIRLRDAVLYDVEIDSKTVTNLTPGMDVAVVLSTLAPYDSTVANLIAPGLANWLGLRLARTVSVTVKTVTDTDPPAEEATVVTNTVAYSYNFVQNADDRALWVPSGSTRKTYGNLTDEDARTVLGCTVAQHSVPPTSFTTSNATFVTWNGPNITVAEGDLFDMTTLLKWDQTANSLDPIESDSTTGYSQADDRNGVALRMYSSLLIDTNFVQDGNSEPDTRPVARWLRNGTWHTLKSSAIADSAGILVPSINIGPAWANVAGTVMLAGIVITVTSRT